MGLLALNVVKLWLKIYQKFLKHKLMFQLQELQVQMVELRKNLLD